MPPTFLNPNPFLKPMVLPDYTNSIVNLTNSIIKARGGNPTYPPLKQLPPRSINTKNILLIVIDGLGFNYIKKHAKNTLFTEHLKDNITSLFPSTTATCITSFLTGVAPQQHAITGWFMHLKEIGMITAILPGCPRAVKVPLNLMGTDITPIYRQKTIFEKIKAVSCTIAPADFINSAYNATLCRKTTGLFYHNLSSFIKATIWAVKKKTAKQKFVYAYWPEFDLLCHEYGTTSKQVKKHTKDLNRKFTKLLKALKGTDTTIIITADHGHKDIPKERIIEIKDHPIIAEALTMPLSGEPRAAYCYIHPSKASQFKSYITKNLAHTCTLHTSEELIKKGYYGEGKPNKNLHNRVGDYILLMKENYAIKDTLMTEKGNRNKSMHGGLSKDEMLVPLIVIKV